MKAGALEEEKSYFRVLNNSQVGNIIENDKIEFTEVF
jgi:hypothetical protein